MKNKLFFLVFASILFSFGANAQNNSDYLNKVWNKFEFGGNLGSANIWCDDFDGDGNDEILFNGNVGYDHTYFTILSYENGEYSPTWSSPFFAASNDIRVIQIANLDNDNDYEIYVLTYNGTIFEYSGDSMELINTYYTNSINPQQSEVADIDGDGDYEFLIVSDSYDDQYLHIYNATDFTLLNEFSNYGAEDVEVGDVDGDGQNEIVLSSGYVLDGSTFDEEWHYLPNGFGHLIELGDVNVDGVMDIIGADNQENITAYNGALHTPFWQFNTGYNSTDALNVLDVDGDGNYEILVGADDYNVAIACFDATTQQKLWENTDDNDGVTNIAVGDPDHDGTKEFMWGSGVGSSGSDHFHVAGFDYYQTEWKSKDLDGYFSVDIGDINNDDTLEIVGSSYGSNSGYDGGNLFTLNGITHNDIEYVVPQNWDNNYCVKTGNINDSPQLEIVLGIGNRLYVYDGLTYALLWRSDTYGSIEDVEIADVDDDGNTEIIIGDSWGYVTVIDGITFEEKWKSVYTGSNIGDIEIGNCDDDDAPEIVFCNYNGIIQIYDGVTHLLQWQSPNINDATTLELCDYNQDGIKDIAVGHSSGKVSFIRCDDLTISDEFQAFSSQIRALCVDNVDSTDSLEILVGANRLRIFNYPDFEQMWQSDDFGNHVSSNDNIIVTDLDNDLHKDVVFSTSWGIFQFEATSTYPDITPPMVKWNTPPDSMQTVGTNTHMEAGFSERIDDSTLNYANITVLTEDFSLVAISISYDTATNKVTLIPASNLFPETKYFVTLSGAITDTAGNSLDGNRNGISDGSPDDDYVWSFTTGLGVDTVGPLFTSLDVDSYQKWAGIPINVNGTITDTSDFACATISDVEYFVDNIGANGEGTKMKPVDGYFNDITEDVEATIETTGWTTGEHVIYFHGMDAIGNWSDFNELTINVEAEQPGSWTMFGNNPQHTGYNSFDTISMPLKFIWSALNANRSVNQVCAVNDKVIVTTDSYNGEEGIYVLNAESGDIIWSKIFGGEVELDAPSFSNGYVYVQFIDNSSIGWLNAYDISTGNEIWHSNYYTQWDQYLAPTIADGRVFIGGGTYGGCYAFNALTGKENWYHSLTQYELWTPAYYNDTVYTYTGASSGYGYFSALRANSGILTWEKTDIPFSWNGYRMNSAPMIDTINRIFITESTHDLTAISMNSHEILWNKEGDFVQPALFNGVLYGINDGDLYAYDIITGQTLWSYSAAPVEFIYPPVISNGHVFVSAEDKAYAVNINTHLKEWEYDNGGYLTVGCNRLFAASSDGKLYAFEADAMGETEHQVSDSRIVLYQNYPNPVSGSLSTVMSYYLPEKAQVELSVFNVNGQQVLAVDHGNKSSGFHEKEVSLERLSPGIYFYRLDVNNSFSTVKKLVVLE